MSNKIKPKIYQEPTPSEFQGRISTISMTPSKAQFLEDERKLIKEQAKIIQIDYIGELESDEDSLEDFVNIEQKVLTFLGDKDLKKEKFENREVE